MLAAAHWGYKWCRYGCCRSTEFVGRHRQKVRKVQRVREKAQMRRELKQG